MKQITNNLHTKTFTTQILPMENTDLIDSEFAQKCNEILEIIDMKEDRVIRASMVLSLLRIAHDNGWYQAIKVVKTERFAENSSFLHRQSLEKAGIIKKEL